jgi:hypothetical protein
MLMALAMAIGYEVSGAADGVELSPYHMTSMFHDLWRITDPK